MLIINVLTTISLIRQECDDSPTLTINVLLPKIVTNISKISCDWYEYFNQLQRLYLFLLTRISRKMNSGIQMAQFDYWLSTKNICFWMNDIHIGRFEKLKWSNRANKVKFISLAWFALHRNVYSWAFWAEYAYIDLTSDRLWMMQTRLYDFQLVLMVSMLNSNIPLLLCFKIYFISFENKFPLIFLLQFVGCQQTFEWFVLAYGWKHSVEFRKTL